MNPIHSNADGIYAHSLKGRPIEEWEPLRKHLLKVAERAASLAHRFGWAELARIAGLLHDIGKTSEAFQRYLRQSSMLADRVRGPDHSAAGARAAMAAYPKVCIVNRTLAYIIAGHHAGLGNADELEGRLDPEYPIKGYEGWQAHAGNLPPARTLSPTKMLTPNGICAGFEQAFLIRMLFSCLVDADFLETEAFYAEAADEPVERGGYTPLEELRSRLTAYMQGKCAAADPSPVNALRERVLNHVKGRAVLSPGLFTLTVPTGGGKTLASLSFALEHAGIHAEAHGLRRVVYVIPFTSIIEQTADVFREALGTGGMANQDDVLEHHASFDWEEQAARMGKGKAPRDDDLPPTLAKLRRSAENWDASIVVTTAVQFFESLFANRTSRCRKLHNLSNSVIVLDEAQTLPANLLLPCMAALDELARNYGSTVVLCTATQPALRKKDAALLSKDKERTVIGLDIDDDRELAADPPSLFEELDRVHVEKLGPQSDNDIAARFVEQERMLCIVNSRKHARQLFEKIRHLPGTVHLSTWMCPRHRRAALARMKKRLACGRPARVISTSLIEAGVDISFPEVWRAVTGLDSVMQAAGRCNRNDELAPEKGRLVVFEPTDNEPPDSMHPFIEAGQSVLDRYAEPLHPEAIRNYFGKVYWMKGLDNLDAVKVGAYQGVLKAIHERKDDLKFPFRDIAEAFRMIDEEGTKPVIVPWRSGPDDTDAEVLLGRIAAMERPRTADLRRLQQYTVTIPAKQRALWLAAGVLRPVHPALEDALLRLDDLACWYDAKTGLQVNKPDERAPESNVMGD